ncbi:MAG: hypothetical protein M0027_13995 [Candidatus Dormibacteraeota bacterium]|nr:hypothetical protein [Candidatus Dormibacteraeota bacterium]
MTSPGAASVDEPLSTLEIAERLGIQPGTLHSWRQRGVFPAPDRVLSKTPIWFTSTVEAWARTAERTIHETGEEKDPLLELAIIARQVEEQISGLQTTVTEAQRAGGDRAWATACSAIANALIPLSQVVTNLARLQRSLRLTGEAEDPVELTQKAKVEIEKVIRARFSPWCPLTEGEVVALVDMVMTAALELSLDLKPELGREPGADGYVLRFAPLLAYGIAGDGKETTLARVADPLLKLIAEVRGWDVWRRIRPGPL